MKSLILFCLVFLTGCSATMVEKGDVKITRFSILQDTEIGELTAAKTPETENFSLKGNVKVKTELLQALLQLAK